VSDESPLRQVALDLAHLTAGEVDMAMRAELEARAACRIAQGELDVAKAKVSLATAEWDNARERLAAARTRFGVGWPAVRGILGEEAAQGPVSDDAGGVS
jgi:membrane-bound lytic murein transglycosylase B